MRYFFLFLLNCFLFACNDSNQKGEQVKDSASLSNNEVILQPGFTETRCYANVSADDSLVLQLIRTGDTARGTLFIKYAGKDQNSGSFSGMINGDTLIADYTFMSEGKESVRQVVFLKREDMMIEGFGPVEEQDGKMIFKDIAALSFNKEMSLKERQCMR